MTIGEVDEKKVRVWAKRMDVDEVGRKKLVERVGD
jgi:hypothetical protein